MMRFLRTTLLAACTFILLVTTVYAQRQDVRPDHLRRAEERNNATFVDYAPNRFVIQFDKNMVNRLAAFVDRDIRPTGLPQLDRLIEQFNVRRIAKQFPWRKAEEYINSFEIDLSAMHIVHFNRDIDVLQVVEAFSRLSGIVKVEPIGQHRIDVLPNDPQYTNGNQWHIDKIQAPQAWDIEAGKSNIIAAVLDTGVRYYHDDLGGTGAVESQVFSAAGNIWRNPGETNNGQDDDGNGLIDDAIGYDFLATSNFLCNDGDCGGQDNDPKDFNGHGTHVAGIIAAMTNNGIHGAGVAGGGFSSGNGVRIMCLRNGYNALFYGGLVDMAASAQGLDYAAAKGAKLANASWGSSNSGGLGAAIANWVSGERLFFKAAGNGNSTASDFLINYASDKIIVVGATDQNDARASFSSYGSAVDIAAPGVGIVSTYSSGYGGADGMASLSGTSMATPMALAVAGLIWSQDPNLTALQVRQKLIDSADPITTDQPIGGRRINAFKAVQGGGGPQPPAAPSNLTANAVSTSQINLTWSDNSNNEDGFSIERRTGTTGTFAEIAQVGANTTSYSNTGLTTSTTYQYRVRAFNAQGNSSYSNTAQATTQDPPQPPAAPSNLTANAVSTSQINLAWSDNSNNEDGFSIERRTGTSGTFTEIAQVGANTTSYSNTGLTASTTYEYRVRAFNAQGNSNYSNTAQATTQDPPPQPPAAPSNLTANAVSSSQINLAWSDNSNNEDGFSIERRTGTTGTFAEIAQVGANTTSYSNTGLAASTTYEYRVRAFNAGGNSNYSNTAQATTQAPPPQPPAAPSNLTANAVSTSQINLTWSDNSNNEDGFSIERRIGTSGTFAEIAQVGANTTSYSNTGLAASTTYQYRVRAFNAQGNSNYSNTAQATTQTPPNTPPVATISAPANGSNFSVGATINYAGDGTDAEDGTLPASAFRWDVSRNGGPFQLFTQGVKSGSATATFPGNYVLRLTVTDSQGATGTAQVSFSVSFGKTSMVLSGDERGLVPSSEIPSGFALSEAYPNPFNPETNVQISLPETAPVYLSVYNSLGQLVRTLVAGVDHSAGVHRYQWDGRDDNGQMVPSGIYLFQVRAGSFQTVRKAMLMK